MTLWRKLLGAAAFTLLMAPVLAGCGGKSAASGNGLETVSTEEAYKRSLQTLQHPGKPLYSGGGEKSEHPQAAGQPTSTPPAGGQPPGK